VTGRINVDLEPLREHNDLQISALGDTSSRLKRHWRIQLRAG